MGFEDLPENWSDVPIDDRLAGDVVDLCVGIRDRAGGCLGLLILDHRRVLVQPMLIEGVTDEAAGEEAPGLRGLADEVEALCGHVILARGRPGTPFITRHDLAWRDRARSLFGERLAGCYLATVDIVRPIVAVDEMPLAG